MLIRQMGWVLMLRSSQLEMATAELDRDFSIMAGGGGWTSYLQDPFHAGILC